MGNPDAPSLSLPRSAGEGTLTIGVSDFLYEGRDATPSPAKRGRAGEGALN
jgi:hypothetical protein